MSVPEKPGAGPGDPRDGGQGHGRRSSERATLEQLAAQPADLLVIGGGITGAGIARDAAMRGLRTMLVEQNDLGSGTSSRSSRLIHGGLRYLEQGELRLVLEANRERRMLQRIAPHLVWPLPFVFPVAPGRPALALAAGGRDVAVRSARTVPQCATTPDAGQARACSRPSRCCGTVGSWAAPATTTRNATTPGW